MQTKTVFTCQSCGYQSPKWLGRCPECDKWNSFAEESFDSNSERVSRSIIAGILSSNAPQKLSAIELKGLLRTNTRIGELDRVLGGGLVEGSAVLVGGEPGIGKSTLMLQVSNIISKERRVLYVSGEESLSQIKLRAKRLGFSSDNLYIVNETDLACIIKYIKELKPYMAVIDSIQTVYNPQFSQNAGTVTQIKESAGMLTALAKSIGVSVFFIGHITKDGVIAGPKVLEHIVDSVIYFEGQKESPLRILRAIKNRFGTTDEVGIFSMEQDGLKEVKDPSGIFILHKNNPLPGSSITAVIEGTRPFLVEIQALVTASGFGMARQRSMGFDLNRMILLIAGLQKNVGLNLANQDIYLNVAGGVKVNEPASDLAVSVAISSSFKERPVRQDTVIMGEVGLTSEVRGISQVRARVNEAKRLGYKKCIIPASDYKSLKNITGIELIGVDNVSQAFEELFI
jgi:DNA repair protein RadA/Sms